MRPHETTDDLVVHRQDAARRGQKHFAMMRQGHRTRIAPKQSRPQHFLQLLDLHGNRRWRSEHRFRGRGEIACIGDGNESPQDIEFQ